MTFIGDIERLVATNLYPLRVPIAIGATIALLGLLLLARRRGWYAAMRRHPERAFLVAALALGVTLPAAWYLGSPLFIRTSLVEPAPVAAGASEAPQAIGSAQPAASSAPAAPSAPAASAELPPAAAPRSGSFIGEDDFHFAKGTATLVQTGADAWVVRFEGFSVRNGPNLHVYLSPGPKGYVDGAVDLGPLKATDGSFNMPVPAGSEVERLRSVVIWCKQFAVQFGVARLR